MSLMKPMMAGAAALAMASALVAASTPAEARGGRNAALFGGLAAGAIVGGAIASAHARPYYAPGYYAPGYYAPAYAAPACWRENRPVYDAWGNFAGYRAIRVCQ